MINLKTEFENLKNKIMRKEATARDYVKVIQLSQEDTLHNFTMTEKWIIGCYKYYRTLLETKENKLVAEKWWKGCIQSYIKRTK